MLVVLVISAFLVILLYAATLVFYTVSFVRTQTLPPVQAEQVTVKVALIIPIRNEAAHLNALCGDLLSQDRDDKEFEVVFVDDHSTDRSAIVLEKFCGEHAHCRLIRLPEGVTGKKHAIAAGVKEATGAWIIQSDADCRLPVGFISGHTGYAAGGADLVAGPVLVDPGDTMWGRFEALEHLGLTATSLAAAAAGRPVMCSGANLSYSKHVYLASEENLLSVPHASGDDVFLLAEAKKHHRQIEFSAAPGMVVRTSPTPGPLAFLRQRIRWGSKARYYRDTDMAVLAVLVWLANTLLAGFLFASLFFEGVFWLFLAALLLKSFSEFLLLHVVAQRLGQKPLLRIFPVAALFYYFYIAVAGILAMAGSFTWKGRRHTG